MGIWATFFSYIVFPQNVHKSSIMSMYSFDTQKKLLRTWRDVMIVCKMDLRIKGSRCWMPAFSQDLCILGKVFSPSQGTLLAEPGGDTESHDLILDQARENLRKQKLKTYPRPWGHRKESHPAQEFLPQAVFRRFSVFSQKILESWYTCFLEPLLHARCLTVWNLPSHRWR